MEMDGQVIVALVDKPHNSLPTSLHLESWTRRLAIISNKPCWLETGIDLLKEGFHFNLIVINPLIGGCIVVGSECAQHRTDCYGGIIYVLGFLGSSFTIFSE